LSCLGYKKLRTINDKLMNCLQMALSFGSLTLSKWICAHLVSVLMY